MVSRRNVLHQIGRAFPCLPAGRFWFFSFARAKEKKEEKEDGTGGNDTYWKTLPNSRSSFNIIIKGDYKNI